VIAGVRRRSARRGFVVALALAVLLSALVPAGIAAAATPATPGLTIVGDATYDVLPAEGRVAVTVVLTATNNLKDTKTKRFLFRVGYVTVLPNTANFALTAEAGKPKVSVSSSTDAYVNLKLDLGANLGAGKSTTVTLTYDILDPGGAPDRPVRISSSLVSFSAWAVAAPSSTGGSVTVRFPAGYDVAVRRGPLDGPTTDALGSSVWTSGILDAPLDFVADFSADRPSDYVETQRTVALAAGPASVVLQAWPDDPAWETRVAGIVDRALPVLERLIGLPWPDGQPLQVRETLVRSTGGYAGIYDPAERRIDIGYAAPDAVVIHELAHAWFNGALVSDRWIAEGFASYYADEAARTLGIDPVPVTPADESAPPFPLNAWGVATPDATDAEAWGYAASLQLAAAIARRAGPTSLQEVWWKAAHGVGAYQPGPGSEEPAGAAPDWRGLLDLLEDATGGNFIDLWRTWVARPTDLDVLADRAVTRGFYDRSVALAGDWTLPPSTRAAMRAWRFDLARQQLLAADAVQVQRAELEASAAAVGATLPATLRDTFEGDAGLGAAAAEASAEQVVVDAIADARAAKPTEHGVGERFIIDVGLLFDDPDASVEAALTAFEAGDLQAAYADAIGAAASWRSAADAGRSRILSVILLALATILFLGMVRRAIARPRVQHARRGTLARHPATSHAPPGARSPEDEGGTGQPT